MMPPKNPRPAPTGDIAPYPSQALNLGGGRYMYINGDIVTKLRGAHPVELQPNTLKFWEEKAQQVHGKSLNDLIV